MTLQPGTKLGPYEIVAPLGSGGMGEVYRARDTRLGRDVAVKVLPEHLAPSPEVRARFEREARTVSSLNHPHICTLHDVGHEAGVDFLVMELIEGESLAERLAKGPLPPSEVLRYGVEIADALDRAHRAGIVHRDLKPGNIMLTKSGAKLMDFGLARSAAPAVAMPGSLSKSPTMTRPLTAEGAIVGTFQYMAPEQIEGQEADARADLWALGATLYEMATGQKAFSGHSQASLIASILKEEPRSLATLAPMSPPALDRVVRACLAKDPEQRIQTAHDVKLQLQWIVEGGSQAGVPAPVAARRHRRESMAWIIAGVAITVAAASTGLLVLRRPAPPRVLRFEVEAPRAATNMAWPRLSPDGRVLAFLASDSSGIQSIWVRPLDAIEGHSLPGTEGAGRPFWSPDSRFLAFIAQSKLRKVPVGGGPPVTVSDAPGGYDGSWGSGNVILFDGGPGDSIRGVPASGGTVRPYASFDRAHGEGEQGWPYFLPDGKHFLFVGYGAGSSSSGTIKLGLIGSFETKSLGTTDGRVEYDPGGWMVFVREGTLLAQPFDPGALKTIGDPVPIGENILMSNTSGNFSVSAAGMIAYRGQLARENSQLVWFDRDGRSLGVAAPPAEYRDVAISPDGGSIAYSLVDAQKGKEDLWVRQLARGTSSRLTFDDGDEINPVWSADGQRIAYTSDRGGTFRVFSRLASGVGADDSLTSVGPGSNGPTDWSRDARRMAVRTLSAGNGWDQWVISAVAGGDPAVQIASSPFNEQWGRFSPDGSWIAYQSTESGRPEIYVRSTSGTGGKWQVSANGGTQPYWRADGKEIYYRTLDQMIVAVPVEAGAAFQAGTPLGLFRATTSDAGYGGARWAPSADGKRFLVNTPLRGLERPRFTVVTNWTSELQRK
jgi:Tol biopolymer transport system component